MKRKGFGLAGIDGGGFWFRGLSQGKAISCDSGSEGRDAVLVLRRGK